MKFLLASLLALLFAIGIGSIAGNDSGYLILAVSGWTIQTSATLFVIMLFLGFIALYFLVRLIVRTIQMPRTLEVWRKHQHQRRAEKYLTRGLINMTEGKWRQAERDFRKAAPYSRAPYVNYLCAARAAQELGAVERRDDYLKLAYHNNPDASLAVGITQAELQLNQNQTEQALATLKHLQNKQPQQNQVKQLLLETYTSLNDWQSVLKLIPALEKTAIYSREQMQAKKLDAYVGLLRQAGKRGEYSRLVKLWLSIPRKLKQHFYLIEVYVNECLQLNETGECEPLLRDALKKQWDVNLVRLYGLVEAKDSDEQLRLAEQYLSCHVRDPVLLLTLGRLCMRNRLWGKARDYLQESLDIEPNPETYYEYARLHDRGGNKEQASLCYEKGLTLATSSAIRI